jgi:FkbM family methyltransferase
MSKARLIRAVGRVPGLARALRWYANRYAEGSVVTIPSGYAQGMRWRRSHQYVNGYWIGQHELEVQAAIARLLSPGDGFIDLGANAGFFTLVGVRKVGASGWCVAVDPDPFNCEMIRAQVVLNDLKNCTVIQAAVAERAGTLQFTVAAPGESTGHLVGAGEQGGGGGTVIDVSVTTIDAICESHANPRLIKVDVEGAEVRTLEGAARTLATVRPIWLVESHSVELGREVRRILSAAGYTFTSLVGDALAPSGDGLPHHSIALPS